MAKIDKIAPGIEQLIRAANGKGDPNRVTRIYVILEGKYFFAEGSPADVKTIPQPPFPVVFESAYSEVFDDKKIIAIERHNNLWLVGTGLRMSEVDPPTWWEDRDKGML